MFIGSILEPSPGAPQARVEIVLLVHMFRKIALSIAILVAPLAAQAQHHAPPLPKSLRLYVFNCGSLDISDPERFRFKKEELATTNLSVGCYLIVHPKGTLMWDVGAVPDSALKPGEKSALEGYATITETLKSQLEKIGYEPSDIEYLAFSHYHYDHVANANQFASATWLARKVERDAMFAAKLPDNKMNPANYSALKDAKTILIPTDDYDVFGDGTVVMKLAPGHTPGHQVLFLKLKKTGPIVLSGDLYHYPEERKLKRVPTFEFDQQQTVETREKIEAFLKESGAQLWIQHDYAANAKLKKAPQFYE
jgi:N-acyl homoserine lactone hydrolase